MCAAGGIEQGTAEAGHWQEVEGGSHAGGTRFGGGQVKGEGTFGEERFLEKIKQTKEDI